MRDSNRRSPQTAANSLRATSKNHTSDYSQFREVIAIAVVGLLLAVLMVDSIVGMSSGFAPSSEVVVMTAGVGADGQ